MMTLTLTPLQGDYEVKIEILDSPSAAKAKACLIINASIASKATDKCSTPLGKILCNIDAIGK